ncbi:MAG TPA: [protein-PII] uridylyltransferase [Micropepsaceae bacterium]|nr:[protein-PII] uridylyltransferase [Micropepsaceae bacterium]
MGADAGILSTTVMDGAQPLDGDALRRDLTALARSSGGDRTALRKAALATIRTAFLAAREQVKAGMDSGVSPGLSVARALSALQDTTIQVLYDFAVRHFYPAPNPTTSERLAIVATGGYGRGLLAPASDIDLLFVRPFKETAWDESVIEFILHMLWDIGLKVGHATRSVPECVRLAKQDITIRTSLLEARFLWGDRQLYDELRKKFWSDVATGSGQDFVEAKLAERDERHKRQGESRYLVEPNVKDGKGGLRDLQTLYWIGKYLYRVEDTSDLVHHGVFTKDEFKTFQKAEAFLWTVRCHLHYLAGRAEERLSFDVQPELAKRLGYVDANLHRAVERFMRGYFLVAKDVGDLTRIFCAALEEQNRKSHPSLTLLLPGFLKLRSSDDDFFVENGRLAARSGLFREDPVNLIRLFHVADSKDLDVHPATLRSVTRQLDLIDDNLRYSEQANRLFLDILCSRRDPERSLRRMNEAGVMGRFMPEFGRVVALMQFNMYHHYTVDEHLLVAVGNVARMERGELRQELPLVSDLIKRVKSREALYVSILMHDMAKGLPGDHSEVGAAMAESVCPRLGLSPADTATVSWLVRHHLVMSDAAQKRDVSDPKTVQNFVHVVQTPERLRMLLILTAADIRAVGPGVWNGWKSQLLRELYFEAETLMSGGDSSPARSTRIEDAKRALEERLANVPESARRRALSRHYDSYWLAFDTDELEFHARLMRAADEKNEQVVVGTRGDSSNSVSEIVVYTPDHPGLFSRLAGAISISNGSIVGAKIFTTSDGYAVDVFQVQDAVGGPFGDGGRIERLKQTIIKTLTGEIKPRAVLAKRAPGRRAAAFKTPPRVNFDNEASTVSTVIEVESLDRVGLLYEITRTLFEAGMSISSAIVATYGELAVDTFYVRDVFGHKVTHPERLASIEARLMKALEGKA